MPAGRWSPCVALFAVYPRPLHVRLVATHHLMVLVSLVGRVYMWNARGVNNGVNINHQTGVRAGSHRVVSPVVYPPPTHVRLVATQLPGVPVPLRGRVYKAGACFGETCEVSFCGSETADMAAEIRRVSTETVAGQRVSFKGTLHRTFPAQRFTYTDQDFQLVVRLQIITVRGEYWPQGRTTFSRGYMPPKKDPPLAEHDESAEHLLQRIVRSARENKEKRERMLESLDASSGDAGAASVLLPASVSRPRRASHASSSGSLRKLSPLASARQPPAKRAARQHASSEALPSSSVSTSVVPAANAWTSRQHPSSSQHAAVVNSLMDYPALARPTQSTQTRSKAATAKTTTNSAAAAIAAITIAPRADGRHSSMGGSLEVSQRANLASSLRPTRLH